VVDTVYNIIAKIDGGTDDPNNLVGCCPSSNGEAGVGQQNRPPTSRPPLPMPSKSFTGSSAASTDESGAGALERR